MRIQIRILLGGALLAPYAAFILAENWSIGLGLCLLAFGAWGMGYNLASVSYLSLASELSGPAGRARTVSIMWFMMIVSIILTAIGVSRIVDPYYPQALIRAFWVVGIVALTLGTIGLLRLEDRFVSGDSQPNERHSWADLVRMIADNRQATLFFVYLTILLAAILGQDVLLEPFGAEAFGMSVKATTRITAIWGVCVLIALLAAGILERRLRKRGVARWGAWGALCGFVLIASSGFLTDLTFSMAVWSY